MRRRRSPGHSKLIVADNLVRAAVVEERQCRYAHGDLVEAALNILGRATTGGDRYARGPRTLLDRFLDDLVEGLSGLARERASQTFDLAGQLNGHWVNSMSRPRHYHSRQLRRAPPAGPE